MILTGRTFIEPSSSSLGKNFAKAIPRALNTRKCADTYAICLSLCVCTSTVGRSTSASVPPDAKISRACSCVPPSEMASKTKSMGSLVMLLTSATTSDLRSTTCVAPNALSRSALCNDAVVMMGEKPESFANWIAL